MSLFRWRMFSVFIQIYIGIILALIAIFSLSYFSIQIINQYRYYKYVAQWVAGPTELIAESWKRLKHNKEKWRLELNKLSGLTWEVVDQVPKSARQDSIHKQLYIEANWMQHRARIWRSLDQASGKYLTIEIREFQEPLSRALGLLILDDIKRLPTSMHALEYHRLSKFLDYPLLLVKKMDLDVDFFNSQILNKGLPVTQKKTGINHSFYTVLIPTQNPNVIIQLGPLPLFHWVTTAIVIPSIITVLILFALSVFVLLSPLQLRLARLIRAIEKIDDNLASIKLPLNGNDSLTDMARQITNMARKLVSSLQKNRELSQAISHELKTPLSRLRFRVESLNEKESEEQHFINGIKRDLYQLEELVKELLFFHKIGEDSSKTFVKFNVLPIVNDLVEELSLTSSHVQFQINIPKQSTIKANLVQFRRLTKNLMENSCKYGKDIIIVQARKINNNFVMTIEDNGEGIPAKQRLKMLQPFTRLDTSRSKSTGGSGLGLAICKRIVDTHSGSITISESRFLGCCLEVSFPITK